MGLWKLQVPSEILTYGSIFMAEELENSLCFRSAHVVTSLLVLRCMAAAAAVAVDGVTGGESGAYDG